MGIFDLLPLLAAGQCLVMLGYLLIRRRSSFANEGAHTILFATMAVGMVSEHSIVTWLGLPGDDAVRVAALAWVLACATTVVFCRDVLCIGGTSRQGWPALLTIPAVLFSAISYFLDQHCQGDSCATWPAHLEAAWGAAVATVSLWVTTRWVTRLRAALVLKPNGQARIAVAGGLAGIMALRLLEALAQLAGAATAHVVAPLATVGYVALLQLIGFALVRLYPEGDHDRETNMAAIGSDINRFRRHLAQAVVFEEGGVDTLVRGTMLTTIFTVLALVGWSAITPVKEVAVTNGQVVPTSLIHSVQHLEGGLVTQVLVREGQLVEKGDVLLRLDPAQAVSELEQTRARESGLALRAERLRAFAEGRVPNFAAASEGSDGQPQSLDQNTIFAAQEKARDSSLDVLEKQISQRKADIRLMTDQVGSVTRQIDVMAKELKLREDLMNEGLTTKLSYFSYVREYERLQGDLARLLGQATTAREALAEAESRFNDQNRKLDHDAYNEMGTVTAELAQLREARSKLEDRVARLEITAPIRGIIQELTVTSPGTVIQQGGLVTKILPVDDALIVESQITPRDIGHVKPGQPVRIKVASYDFARFGAVSGKLIQVSPSTFLDEKKAPYYKGQVALDKGYVGDKPDHNLILPGMTVQVDIITGEKTILQYLLKPIYLAATQAFQER